MVFSRKRKDNRSSSFILDDSPKRTKVQAQRKFAQGSNVNSPVLTPVTEIEIQEKVIPEPIELLPMKRPNTEDFLTFLCFRGTPALPPSLSFFNNVSMTEGHPPTSESPSSSKNGVILPSNISKTQGEKPFIAFGVRKRADPIVVSRHMDKKRRHALALQALRRKYQEQKMAKIRAITISKLSEKVHTNKTVVRTTRSVTKAEPITKKSVGQKTKITVVATKHVKVTTRRTSTQIKQTANTGIKQKMCLRNLRNRVVRRELEKKKKPILKKDKKIVNVKQEKIIKEKEEDEDDEYTSEDSESQDEKSEKSKKKYQLARKEVDARITRSNIIATRRNKRLMIRQQSLKAAPTSPRLRSQLRRKILQTKSEITVPLNKRRILTRKVQIKTKTISKKVAIASKNAKEAEEKVKRVAKVDEKRTSVRDTTKKRQDTSSPELKKSKVKKPVEDKNIKKVTATEEKNKKGAEDKIKKVVEEKSKKLIEERSKKLPEEKNKKLLDEKKKKLTEEKNKKLADEKAKKITEEKNKKALEEKVKEEKQPKVVKSPPEVKKKEVKVKESLCNTAKEKEVVKDKKEHDIKPEMIKQEKSTKKLDVVKKIKEDKEKKPIVGVKDIIEAVVEVKILPVIENNRILIDKDVIIEEVQPFKETKESMPLKKVETETPKVNKKQVEKKISPKTVLIPKKIDKKLETKPLELKEVDKIKEPSISQRPSRKTKVAAAIYMEILGRKLVNDEDIDDMSIDSFPELPNVRRMEQRENELKAKMSRSSKPAKDLSKLDKKGKESESETEKSVKQSTSKPIKPILELSEKRKTRNPNCNVQESASDNSFTADIRTPTPKIPPRQSRNVSPKLYKNFSDSESEVGTDTKLKTKKRKSENAADLEGAKKTSVKKKTKKVEENREDDFSESDEEPLAKFTQKASEKSKSESGSNMAVKQKRECAKRPQNYLPLFSSSDEEEKFFRGFQSGSGSQVQVQTKKKIVKTEPVAEALSTKDIGRRFGKGKVNMSNEQIEKWLNDSVMAGMTLIKAENDEMLKFGERIPTETTLDGNLSAVNTEHLKNSLLLKTEEKEDRKPDPISSPVNTTPDKSTTSSQKPLSSEKKMIFRKADKMCKNTNAFSACNESSVYAFEADNEDSVSTPFRRPSRRPSSTATSRSEDDVARLDLENKNKFRLPVNTVMNKAKQEVSLMLTDESNNSGSITVQVNLESTDNEPQTQADNEHMFYIPFQPGHKPGSNIQGVSIKMGTEGSNNSKLIMSAKLVRQNSAGSIPEKTTPMFPPSSPIPFKKLETKSKASCSMSETSDDFKYKVPSSPSASSSSSAKLVNKKKANEDFYKPINTTEFPHHLTRPKIVEAPVFHPTEKEFVDPLEYFEKIRNKAERFGICRIIPPNNFKPECKVLDEMRFTAYNQYVHKMMHRWGPNFKELVAIRKYLATQSISLKHPPWIGGIEIDLPKLYQTVQTLGGLKEVIEKKKWPRVSELMKIPKSAQDRVTKLDDIYCKYLLPYDTLSPDERDKLFTSVESDWTKREAKMLEKAKNGTNLQPEVEAEVPDADDDEESDEEDESDIECIVKGRGMALSAFYRIARNTMAMWFKEGEPTPQEVEEEFWKHVTQKEHHICVHSGSIDSGNLGYGFAVSKNSPFARHAWNLKVLTNNSGSILRSMGPVMGLTVPTLHVGMLYAGCCWYRDPHSLPWIEYLHTGAKKIWYGIPDSMSDKFHETMVKLVPHYCLNKSLWLPTDTVMVPPSTLVDNGVSLTKTVQEPGEFIVIFPKAFTSNICAGYVVSESVFFAPPDWLSCADKVFLELRNSCEPSMFSYERLLLSMAEDTRSDVKVLRRIILPIQRMIDREKKERETIKSLGIKKAERLPLLDAKRKKKMQDTDTEYICEECRWNLYCSMICDSSDNAFYCLEHAIENIQEKRLDLGNCKLMYTYDDEELSSFVAKINSTIEAKLVKKVGSKFAGMATLLNR